MLVSAIWPEGDPNFHPLLVSDGPQQRLRLPAQRRAPGYDYGAEADALTSFYDAAPALIEAARTRRARRPWRSVLWLLPDFAHAYYGGVATILRFAEYLVRRHGVRARFAVAGVTPPDVLGARICEAFPGLAGSGFHRIASFADAAALPYADAGFATLWTTAYYLLHADVGERCYFVQDNEPQFYPAGSTSALVETTYRFGLRAVCNTATLAEVVRAYGGEAVHFVPAVDPDVFHRGGRRARGGPKRLFAYGRPGHARNGFELLSRALVRVKQELGDEVDIVTAGAPWSPAAYGLDGVLTNLGLLGYRSTGDLYRACDAGLVLMMTSHPSYLPMELMACGAAVVTNRNPRTAWLLRDGENALLAETTPSAIAARVVDALADDPARALLTERASAFVRAQRTDWDGEWDRLVEELWS
jgi:glycosyltransferase involved in cell wall biosynthesis